MKLPKEVIFGWVFYSILWAFAATLLIVLGYFFGALHGMYPETVNSPVDFLIPEYSEYGISETLLDIIFFIEVIVAFIAAILLDYSHNKLLKTKVIRNKWKKSIGDKIETN